MPTPTNLTRIQCATGEQALAVARRSCAAGTIWVQQYALASWSTKENPCGQWNTLSSHSSMKSAEQAKAKLDRKLQKLAAASKVYVMI